MKYDLRSAIVQEPNKYSFTRSKVYIVVYYLKYSSSSTLHIYN